MTDQLPVDPRELVRRFRGNYVNLHTLWTKGPHAPDGVTLRTPQEAPISEADLSAGIRGGLADYRKKHPGARIDFLKYQRVENGQPVLVVEDDTGLPEEDALLSLS